MCSSDLTPVFLLLPAVVLLALGLGTWLKPLLEAPVVWAFAIVTLLAQLLGQLLPDRLAMLRSLLPILSVLPLLGSNSTWLSAWHQLLSIVLGLIVAVALTAAFRLPQDNLPAPAAHAAPASPAAHAASGRPLEKRLQDPYFWRKVVASTFALAVGQGLGAVNPKYVY